MREQKDIEYFVNRERGIVVCKINKCSEIAIDRIRKYCKSDPWARRDYIIPYTFTGIAKCAPEDEFDEEYGKKLALLRAKQARGAAVNAMIYKYIDTLHMDIENLFDYAIHDIPKEDR